MIDPQRQWCIQIEVTNACTRACSNCTRFVGHIAKPFFVSPEQFAVAVDALVDFPTESPPTQRVPHKVVGMIGGEPLLHPQFADLATIMQSIIPRRENRGLWTGLDWRKTKHSALIERTFGYVNNNQHKSECRHSPILVAVSDVIPDAAERERLIDNCWLQEMWSATITPKGFFFCEVAGAMDMLFDGPGGLPVEPGCWRRPLEDFRDQIERWCPRCGVPLNLRGRIDHEGIDDISESNVERLRSIGSERVASGGYVLHEQAGETTNEPWRYLG